MGEVTKIARTRARRAVPARARAGLLAERCILAGSRVGTAVIDPFIGSGTVGLVAEGLGRRWLGCELNAEYESLVSARLRQGFHGRRRNHERD